MSWLRRVAPHHRRNVITSISWRMPSEPQRLHPTIRNSLELKLKTPAPRRNYGHVVRHSELISEDLKEYASESVSVAGLVRSIRKQKRVAFVHISDGTTLEPIQAIIEPSKTDGITNGSFVELSGQWVQSSGKGQAHELRVTDVKSIGTTIPEEFPIQKKAQTPEFLRSLPHFRFRTPFYSLLARVRSKLVASVHSYYASERRHEAYVQVHPPLITSSDCEGAGEVFTISPKANKSVPGTSDDDEQNCYFRSPKYLTVSSQLHLEAYSAELGNVWALSPTFRAEESETPRHLSEFYMLEAELRSVTSLEEVMREAESLVKYMVESVKNDSTGQELLSYYTDTKYATSDGLSLNLQARWDSVLDSKWQIVTYSDAIDHLKNHHDSHPNDFVHAPNYDTGLQLEHERWLVANIATNMPLFVTHFPRSIKPFYMLPSNSASDTVQPPSPPDDHDTVACFDLLFPHGTAEVIGGSLREHRLEELIHAMREKGLIRNDAATSASVSASDRDTSSSPALVPIRRSLDYPHLRPGESLGSLQWYTDLRRFGSSPHGGFGIGFDRLLAYLSGVSSVKDTVGFPRYFGRADC